MSSIRQRRRRQGEAGFTLVEVLIAGMVLVVGLLGIAALFATAVGNNGRSRLDSTSTMLAQSVIEQITAKLARGGPLTVTDCKGTTWMIAAGTGGANLSGSGVDFTQPQSDILESGCTSGTGSNCYAMNYAVCTAGGGESETTAIYDVRWHIQQISTSYLVTVAAKPASQGLRRFSFGLPVTLRTYVGPQ